MAEDAAQRTDNNEERNEGETTGRLERLRRFAAEEVNLFAGCVQSASPDRSSAAVLFLVLFAVFLTCTLSRYLMASQPGRFPNYVVPWLIICLEVFATVCLGLLWCYARNRPCDASASDAALQPWHRLLRRNIKLFGIVPFFFAIFVFDVFRFVADMTCLDAWAACSNGAVRVEHITDVVYPLVRTVYLCVELIVCVKFNAADFFQNTLVLAGLAVVQATNLSGWLDALVDESAVFSSERNWTYELSRCFNGTDVNISDHFVQCFNRSTGEYEMLESASPYLYPFIMEYLMLVIECVADWFFSDANRHHHETPPPTMISVPLSRPTSRVEDANSAVSACSMANDESGTSLRPTTSFGSTQQPQQGAADVSRVSSTNSVLEFDAAGAHQADNVPLIDAKSHASTSTIASPVAEFEHVDADVVGAPETWYDRCPRVLFSVILPLIASVLFVIFGIYNFCLGRTEYRNLFMCYRSAYWLALSLAALLGYAASRGFHSEPMNPNGFEYFVILSCIGPILQSIFTIVANLRTGDLVPKGMFLTEEITNIVHICTQVIFYAYAKSVQIRTDGADENNDRPVQRKRSILMSVISGFAVCNFAIWVQDSFIETRNSETSWQKEYFNNWPVIYNIFNPLALVFRFNSVLLFLNVLFDKRR